MSSNEKKSLLNQIDAYLNDYTKFGLVDASKILNQASFYLVDTSQNNDLSEDEQQEELELWTNLIGKIQLSLLDREQEAIMFSQNIRRNLKKSSDKDIMAFFYLSKIYLMVLEHCENKQMASLSIRYWTEVNNFLLREAQERKIDIQCFEALADYLNEGSEEEAINVSEKLKNDAPKKSLLKRFKENPKSVSKKELEDLMDRQLDVLSSIQKELSLR